VPPSDDVVTVVLMRGDDEVASWTLRPQRPDLARAEELARLQLAAKRMGCRIHLRHAGDRLLALLDLIGLRDVVTVAELRVEVVGQPERGEQAGVDEVVVRGDPLT
jgi:hypothetical protein